MIYDRVRKTVSRVFVAHRKELIIDSAVIVLIIFLSLHDYLGGNGYYAYSDWTWPLAGGIAPSGIFSAGIVIHNYISVLQFTRDVITWPYLLISQLVPSTILQEKIFIFYLFALYLSLAYIFSELLVTQLYALVNRKARFFEKEFYKLISVIFIFSNLSSMNLNADGGVVSDSLIVVFMGISYILLLNEKYGKKSVLLSAVLFSTSLLLDPDYGFYFLIGMTVVLLCNGFLKSNFITEVKKLAEIVAISLPSAIFILISIYLTFNPSGEFTNYRTLTLQSVISQSRNLTIYSAFVLFGHGWSTMVFSPPSILLYTKHLTSLKTVGNPTQLLLPPGLVTTLWLISLGLLPFICYASLLNKRFRSLSVPTSIVALSGLAISQYARFDMSLGLVAFLVQIPVIGHALGTSLALPGHSLQLISSAYILLFPIGSFSIIESLRAGFPILKSHESPERVISKVKLTKNDSFRADIKGRYKSNLIFSNSAKRRLASLAVSFLLLSILVIAGWQAFNGSYFPARAQPPFVNGNGVPDSAPFQAVTPSIGTAFIYNYLQMQRGSFNIFWPTHGASIGTDGSNHYLFDAIDGPKPQLVAPAFQYLVSNGLGYGLVGYLRALNIKYVVIQNAIPIMLKQFYGMASFSDLLNFFNGTNGIKLVYHSQNNYLYEISGTLGVEYNAPLLLHYDQDGQAYSISYSAFESLGINAAISEETAIGQRLSINSGNGSVRLYSPAYIGGYDYWRNSSGSIDSFEGIHETIPASDFANFSRGAFNNSFTQHNGPVSIGNWTVTDWTNNLMNVTVVNGSIAWNSSKPNVAALSYNGTLSYPAPGGVTVLNNFTKGIVVRTSFLYRTSPGFSGSLSVYGVSLNSSLMGAGGFAPVPLPTSSNWTYANITGIFPPGIKYFNTRIQAQQFTGDIQMKDVNMSWSYLVSNNYSSFGYSRLARNETAALPAVGTTTYVSVSGNGEINGNRVESSEANPTWMKFHSGQILQFKGDLLVNMLIIINASSLSSLEGSNVVYASTYFPNLEARNVTISSVSVPSIDDLNIFTNFSLSSQTSIYFKYAQSIQLGYAFLLIWLSIMTAIAFDIPAKLRYNFFRP